MARHTPLSTAFGSKWRNLAHRPGLRDAVSRALAEDAARDGVDLLTAAERMRDRIGGPQHLAAYALHLATRWPLALPSPGPYLNLIGTLPDPEEEV